MNTGINANTSSSSMNKHVDPSEQRANDLVNLFSHTLHCLASDAAAVRQASSFARIHEGEENDNQDEDMSNLEERLIQLDSLVTNLEGKVSILRQIVTEEKRAVAKFESSLQQEAQEQAAWMQQVLEALQRHEIQLHHPEGDGEEHELAQQDSVHHPSSSSWLSSQQQNSSRRDSVDPRHDSSTRHVESENYHPIALSRITHAELDDYRVNNVLGPRISLLDLNQALEEIEQLCQEHQLASQQWKRKQSKSGSSSALQRRQDYLHKRQQPQQQQLLPPGDDSVIAVTEQDLREHCPFFRHGESTARATLAVLCSLRRLKQVPQKNRQVIYHLLV